MSAFEIKNSELNGVKVIKPPTIYEDFRGHYIEIYNKRLYAKVGIKHEFLQDDISVSRKHVLRGIHGDRSTWKLISCLHGAFYLVVVNNDTESSQYRKWTSFTLSDSNRLQVLVPPKFGNGHLVLTEMAIFHYKQTSEYNRETQFTISFNDSSYNIWWPINAPILSLRDGG